MAALGVALAVGGFAGGAWAEPPSAVRGPIADTAGVLGGDTGKVQQSIDELKSEDGLDLHVVFVKSFDGLSPDAWAKQAFEKSGFGGNDVLYAIATEDRLYSPWTTEASGLTRRDLDRVNREDVEPALSRAANGQGSWADAVIAAADGLGSAKGGGGSGGGGGVGTTVAVGGGALAVALGGAALLGSRRRRKHAQENQGQEGQAGTPQDRRIGPVIGGPGGPAGSASPAELAQRSAAALVALDDEIRSSGEELAFAEAQFGTQATVRFREALEKAKAGSVEAFRIQHQIDDGEIAEPQRPGAWQRIIDLATEADEALEEHAEEFRQMRNLQSKVPQMLGDLETRIGEVTSRIPAATQQLQALRATYSEQALRTVRANVDHAGALVKAARGLISSGREHLSDNDRPAAVVSARGAEDALGQATSLLDAVDRAHLELPRAAEELDRRLASISSDVADAERLGADDQFTRDALAAASTAIEQGRAARSGGDPLGALAALDAAENDLDNALQRYRDAEVAGRRTRADLEERFDRARARLMSIDETIRVHRGAVGTDARTRISEALRVYNEATGLAASDPERALSLLARAQQLGEEALRLADEDQNGWGGGGGGSWGGGPSGGGYRGRGRSGGIDLGSLVLGGILAGGLGGGGHDSGWGGGGGFGGGGGGFGGG
ncbi:TPM domain-containing protein, partial [Mobilicoccus sp.]|uniref:TPM domain-containing protein n=1 Tax=Mobilicoccus sp. TaxID=2034349 RepID=UPI0028A09AF8